MTAFSPMEGSWMHTGGYFARVGPLGGHARFLCPSFGHGPPFGRLLVSHASPASLRSAMPFCINVSIYFWPHLAKSLTRCPLFHPIAFVLLGVLSRSEILSVHDGDLGFFHGTLKPCGLVELRPLARLAAPTTPNALLVGLLCHEPPPMFCSRLLLHPIALQSAGLCMRLACSRPARLRMSG